jgi:hypothetical protein
MSGHHSVVHAVYGSDEFNAVRQRLPRAVRRTVEPAPPEELGLIEGIVSREDCTLATVYARAPCATYITRELSRLEAGRINSSQDRSTAPTRQPGQRESP